MKKKKVKLIGERYIDAQVAFEKKYKNKPGLLKEVAETQKLLADWYTAVFANVLEMRSALGND